MLPGAVDYSYLITNTGNVTLTGIALKDTNTDFGAGLSGDDPGAGGDDDLQCRAHGDAGRAGLWVLTLVNSVDAGSDQGAAASDSLSLPVARARLTVEKSSTTVEVTAPAPSLQLPRDEHGQRDPDGHRPGRHNTAQPLSGTTLAPAGTTTCSAVPHGARPSWTWVGLSTTASTRAPTRGPWRATR